MGASLLLGAGTATPMAATSASVPRSGLLAYWSLDDGSGTSATDATGNGNTGTLFNSTTWIAGLIGDALHFDGISQYAKLPDLTALTDYTVSFWMNPARVGTSGGFGGSEDENDCAFSFESRSGARNCLVVKPYQNVGVNFEADIAGTGGQKTHSFTVNTYQMVTATRSGTSVQFSIDGVHDGSLDITVGSGSFDMTDISLGAHYFTGGDHEHAQCAIDELGIWSRSLSGTEITGLWNGGAGVAF